MSTTQFQIEVLFEDEDLIILNKPAGIVVNDAQTVPGETVQGWMSLQLPAALVADKAGWEELVPENFNPEFGTPWDIFKERQGMVHRLDKNTSGVLVWAKNPGSLVNLLWQFKTRQVEKEYLALVHGKIAAPQATLSYPLGRASRDRKLFAVVPDGKPAVTEYITQEVYSQLEPQKVQSQLWSQLQSEASERLAIQGIKTSHELQRRLAIYQGFTLVKCYPKTGRTHQIRVHLAHIRHPIVGDVTYVGRKRQALDPLWCSRQFLHASLVSLLHPRTGEKLSFKAPLAPELQMALSYLVP